MDNLKKILDKLNLYADDIGCMKDGKLGGHNIEAKLNIVDENDESYELIGINMGCLGGCGCPSDIELVIRKVEE